MSGNEVKLVKIYASYNQFEFGMIKSLLESAGINVLVKNEELQNLGLPLLVGPLEIYVNQNDEVDAKAIIADAKNN